MPRPSGRRPAVGLNAHLLDLRGTYRSAGLTRYIYHLLERLPAAAPDLELHGFTGEPRAPAISAAVSWHLSRVSTRGPLGRIFWEQIVQPWHVRAHRLSVLHSLGFVPPLLARVASVVTVPDLSFLFYPHLLRRSSRWYLRWGTWLATRGADRIIALSASTKRDLVRVFRLAPERIRVVHCGVDEHYFAEAVPPLSPATAGQLPERFVLHVGTLEPRKNIARLVRAFARAKASARLPHRLVLAGARGWSDRAVDQAIEATGLRDHVVMTGHVAPDELPALYRAAEAFVYPSLYEGFGLPPLEALASGVPVIVSNAASLPEVVGDAGLYVDPRDEAALADALVSILTDPAQREALRARGPARARAFSWTRTAEATAAVYREVLAGTPRRGR